MTWAVTIQAIRLEGGLTQGELAAILGIDQGSVSRWERGASAPTGSRKALILEKLKYAFPKAFATAQTMDKVRADPKQLVLTAAGSFTPVAMSRGSSLYLAARGVPEGSIFSYTSPELVTDQTHKLFTQVSKDAGLFVDPTIHEVEASCAVLLPDGTLYRNTSTIIPVRFNDEAPRLIIRKVGHDPHDGGAGTMNIRRIVGADEHLKF